MRFVRLTLTALALAVGCGADGTDAEPDEDDDDTFTTTTNSQPPTTGTDGSGSTTDAGTTSDGGTTAATASTEATTGDGTSTDPDTDAGGGSSSTGGPIDPLSEFDDEFDDPATLSTWTLRSEAESEPADHSLLDIGQTEGGKLTVRPTAGGWFEDFTGFFLYIELDGDFMVETKINAGRLTTPDFPPTRPYNSAGLLVRDPSSVAMAQNWVTHNVGNQLESVATEGKSTLDSASSLELFDGPNSGRLRICRVGTLFVLTRKLAGESQFTQTHQFARADLPSTLQVGLMAAGWNSMGSVPNLQVTPDIEARFDYIRFRSITSEADCLVE